jgi:prepilin-type N-terminal cleavage/methylation domain-containing protein
VKKKNGFTFLEVMVTVAILAIGLVMIYKAFLLSLDHQNYLIHRLYANVLMDQKIGETRFFLQEKGAVALEKEKKEKVEHVVINNRDIPFTIARFFQKVPGIENFLQMDIGISWFEHGRPIHLTRSLYISRY